MAKKTRAELEAQIQQLKADNDILRVAAQKGRKKIDSEYFLKSDGETVQDWKGLSETKRYFETVYPDFLSTLNGGERMTGKQFHKLLAEKLGLI